VPAPDQRPTNSPSRPTSSFQPGHRRLTIATNNLQFRGIYHLPFGAGQSYLNHGYLVAIFGGFQLKRRSFIVSGTPFSVLHRRRMGSRFPATQLYGDLVKPYRQLGTSAAILLSRTPAAAPLVAALHGFYRHRLPIPYSRRKRNSVTRYEVIAPHFVKHPPQSVRRSGRDGRQREHLPRFTSTSRVSFRFRRGVHLSIMRLYGRSVRQQSRS